MRLPLTHQVFALDRTAKKDRGPQQDESTQI